MTTRELSFLAAALGHLAIIAGVSRYGPKNPLARPMMLLSAVFFSMMVASLVNRWCPTSIGDAFEIALTSITPPVALNFVVTFVGRQYSYRRLTQTAFVVFGIFAALSFALTFMKKLSLETWSIAFLFLWVVSLGFNAWCLYLHAREGESARARFAAFALLLGGGLASTDILRNAGATEIAMAPLGILLTAALLAAITMRFRLFDTLLRKGHSEPEALARLGRMSAQMSHDLKNPLTALLGAVQVLKRSATTEDQRALCNLVQQQAQRMRGILERYERTTRVEPLLSLVDLNALVTRVAAAHPVNLVVAPDLGEVEIDPDLFASAVENLIDNARHATQDAARPMVEIRTESDLDFIRVHIADNGHGIDPEMQEAVWDDFTTTKAHGSGLGLAFVRRVLIAHGGGAHLVSKRGIGTTVTLRIPRKVVRRHRAGSPSD
jgi:signal transduction histidine kinase